MSTPVSQVLRSLLRKTSRKMRVPQCKARFQAQHDGSRAFLRHLARRFHGSVELSGEARAGEGMILHGMRDHLKALSNREKGKTPSEQKVRKTAEKI